MFRSLVILLAIVFSVHSFGALLYEQDFEGTASRTTWPTASRYYEILDGLVLDKQLWCYTASGIGGFDSWRSSHLHVTVCVINGIGNKWRQNRDQFRSDSDQYWNRGWYNHHGGGNRVG